MALVDFDQMTAAEQAAAYKASVDARMKSAKKKVADVLKLAETDTTVISVATLFVMGKAAKTREQKIAFYHRIVKADQPAKPAVVKS